MHGRFVAGAILILIGVGLFLDARGTVDFGNAASTYWPILLIVVGAATILSRPSRPLEGIVLIALGVVFQLSRLHRLPPNWSQYVWAAALLAAGIVMLVRPRPRRWEREPRHDWHGSPRTVDADRVNVRAFLSGVDQTIRSNAFKGGQVEALFGGARLDLRQAALAPEGARLDVSATFGGVDLFVPASWNVQVHPRPMLGGVSNRTMPSAAGSGPALDVYASATFGGVEIRN